MPKTKTNSNQTTSMDPAYKIRRPGRPRKSEVEKSEADRQGSTVQKVAQGESFRFEMRLPPGMVADLELMRDRTGNTFAGYIRKAIERALETDKKAWNDT
jgi:hypothetical protein